MSAITYLPAPDGPFKVGEYDGDDILMFGAYRVQLEDFVYLHPHSGTPHTVGAEPLDLDDADVRAILFEMAKDMKHARMR